MGTQRRSVQALLDDSKAAKFILLEGESLFSTGNSDGFL